MKTTNEQLKIASNTVRCLCADMVEKANSGHPGAPMGMADFVTSLWLNNLNVDPTNPSWRERDRLVFSGGHASTIVYALFHLSGMGGVTIDELKNFRQWGSRCAGHPEKGVMPGVEVTTGPLGQGIAMGVGLALAAKKAKTGNKTWIVCGDGDLEEGISHEACSWAGAMKLDDLVLLYDSNHITIEGDTSIAMADDAKKRFESYGWKVFEADGHDFDQIGRVLKRAEKVTGQPVMVIFTTHIGFGAPTKHDTAGVHGAPLGAEELAGAKKALGFDPEQSFHVPAEVYQLFADRTAAQHRYARRIEKVKKAEGIPDFKKASSTDLLCALPRYEVGKSVATRNVCGEVMSALAPLAPGLIGGSADLGPSNKTVLKGQEYIGPGSFEGRNVHFGIRELAMSAIVNGFTAFGEGLRGFGATFFVFSDYCRPAIRLAALMNVPSIFVFSHDSFYVGEDGPTHEPIEHIAALRGMINVFTWRPADANELAYAWVEMLGETKGPSCILTTRQNVPTLEGVTPVGVANGGYELFRSGPQNADTIIFIASGSEVALSLEAAKRLAAEGTGVRVVSMPCVERFLNATEAKYRDQVLPPDMPKRMLVEAGSKAGLDCFRIDSRKTAYVSIDHYGASAPDKVLAEKFGFTVDNVCAVAKTLIEK